MDSLSRPSYTGPPRSVSISDPESYPKKGRRVTLSGISNILPPHLERVSCCTGSSIQSEHMQSQWELLMRKFSEDRKRQDTICEYNINNISGDLRCEWRKKKTFATGSSYDGTWDGLGLCGYGRYTFPNGVVYEGEFEDSNFHGEGELQYPDGIVVKGRWHQGEIVEKKIIFSDGVIYREENWDYCKGPDRRYSREYKDLVGAGASNITNEPMKKIPKGTFDAGDGVYYPKLNSIFAYDDPNHFIRTEDGKATKWLTENCRFSPDQNIGPCPHLYEEWVKPSLTLPDPPPAPACYPVTTDGPIDDADSCYHPFPWETRSRAKKSVSCDSVTALSTYKIEPRKSKEPSVHDPPILSASISRRQFKPTHDRISEECEL